MLSLFCENFRPRSGGAAVRPIDMGTTMITFVVMLRGRGVARCLDE